MTNDILPGGKADDSNASDFDQDALDQGIEIEMEHTDDPDIAEEIATDHLSEDEEYYDKLAEMEADAMDEIDDQESERYEDPIKYGATYHDHEQPFSLKPTTNAPKPMHIEPTGGKQQTLFQTSGEPGQMNLFKDTGVPDELLPKHLREPAKPPEPPKPKVQKSLFRKSWSEQKDNGQKVHYTLYAEVVDE